MQSNLRLHLNSVFKAFAAWTLCLCAAAAHAQAPAGTASVLVLGGASHTQTGFPDPRIEQFYVATAANSAEKLALALTAAGVRNAKFIDWSRSPGYQQELGMNIAACSCNFLMQVSFGKNVGANPQTLFFEYQLLYLAKSESAQPGMNAVRTEQRFRRKFEVPVSQAGLVAGNFEAFASEVVADMVKSDAFSTAEKPQ